MSQPTSQSGKFAKRVVSASAIGSVLALVLAGAGALAQSGDDGLARLPQGAGRAEFAANCSKCHAIGTVTAKAKSAADWDETLAKMKKQGLIITPADEAAVRSYLLAHYQAKEGGMPAAMPVAGGEAKAVYPRPSGANQWPAYGGGDGNTNFSPLTQITARNVGKLQPAWTFRYGTGPSKAGDQGLDARFEVTPLLIGGVMYISTPASPLKPDLKASITALRPETGEVIWKYESPRGIHGRGIAYWAGDAKTAPRIFFGTDEGYLMAVDVTTGQPAKGFGRGGVIDAYIGVANEIVGESRRSTFTIPNPVTIWHDLIITGARPGEGGPPQPRGDIRAFDARTGRQVWAFHVIPEPGEANHDTWVGDEWRETSGANVWSTMAIDEARGILYAPTGDANSGGKGPQLYSDTLLALDAATGKLIWHRQLTHHDIWDWDSPTPPLLTDVRQGGKTVPAVMLTGKHGLFFMFDRVTGEPLNGFSEKPTPQPEVPNAEVWPTQPFPDAPGPIARVKMTREEIPDLVAGMKASCTEFWDKNGIVSADLYAPRQSSAHATITYPGPTGGPNWGGGSYSAPLGYYFVNVQNRPVYRPKVAASAGVAMMNRQVPSGPLMPRPTGPRPPQGFTYSAQGVNLSCGATPWGELVAVDVAKRSVAWRVPLGITEALGKAGLNTGAANIGGNIVTAGGVVFIGASNDHRFRAFDAKTGKLLWQTVLEASAHSTPVSYMGADGKQYVVVAAGGGTAVGGPEMSDTLVAFRLGK